MGKKKIIIIAVFVIALIALIVGVTIVFLNNPNEEKQVEDANVQEENGESRLLLLKNKLEQTQNYSVSLFLNDDNQRITLRKDEEAKIEIFDEGEITTYVIKDGTTYMTVGSSDKVYKYENNTSLLNDFINNIDEINHLNFETGKETIEGKEYRYEEFDKTAIFAINYKNSIDESNSKTRLYFEGDNLKYIKSYIRDVEQLLTVEIEFNNQKGNYM